MPNYNTPMLEGLKVQVNSLERDYQDLKLAVVSLDKKIDTGMALIAEKLDARGKTPWGVIFAGISVLVTMLGLVGTMAYVPIKGDIQELKEAQIKDIAALVLSDQRIWDAVTQMRKEMDQMIGREQNNYRMYQPK